MTTPPVRARKAEDLPDATAALVSVHATDGYPVEGVGDPVAWLEPEGLLSAYVARSGGRVVGHVAVMAQPGAPGYAVLARLFVVREARGLRLGEALVRAAETYAAGADLRLTLDVLLKDTAAIRLYDRLGWTRTGALRHTFGEGRHVDGWRYAAPGAPADSESGAY